MKMTMSEWISWGHLADSSPSNYKAEAVKKRLQDNNKRKAYWKKFEKKGVKNA